ncbi:MAG: hypothetical protein OEY03_03575 [Rhizobacter sp.]|nr:hypothetical protein [Rhizobacter sp.]
MTIGRRVRQGLAAVLVVAGAALMLLSPSVGPGLIAFACGIGLELVGRVLERRDPP